MARQQKKGTQRAHKPVMPPLRIWGCWVVGEKLCHPGGGCCLMSLCVFGVSPGWEYGVGWWGGGGRESGGGNSVCVFVAVCVCVCVCRRKEGQVRGAEQTVNMPRRHLRVSSFIPDSSPTDPHPSSLLPPPLSQFPQFPFNTPRASQIVF